jgi:hypothetical protein
MALRLELSMMAMIKDFMLETAPLRDSQIEMPCRVLCRLGPSEVDRWVAATARL